MNKKNYFVLAKNVLKIASLCFIPFVFATCDVGLGESVDTGAPSLSISYPPEGAVVRDWFRLAGSCSDDKGVSRVAVTLTNTSTNQSFGPGKLVCGLE